MSLFYGGQGVAASQAGLVSNAVTLGPGQVFILPSNWYQSRSGKYTALQYWDQVLGCWRSCGGGNTNASMERGKSDGNTYRLANQTGCAVGALLTAAGSGYTSAPVVTPSAGGSLWRAIVGGAVATAITITNAGNNYTYPPLVFFASPPAGGIQATGYATITAGAITAVTVTDQGAGYASPPAVTFINDPREGLNNVPLGYGAAAVCTLTGAGTVTGVICIDHGNPITGNVPPTLAFAGGGGTGAAATVIMCWTMTAYTVTTGGAGYTTNASVSAMGGFPTGAAAYTNPTTQQNWLKTRSGLIIAAQTAGAIVAAGQSIVDGGIYPGVPQVFTNGTSTTGAALGATMGGLPDTSLVFVG